MTTPHTSGAADLPEALNHAAFLESIFITEVITATYARLIAAELRRLHALAAGQAVAPVTPVPRWDEMIRQQFPDMLPKEWTDTLIQRYMARELDALRATRPAPPAMDGAGGEDGDRYRWLRRWKGQEHEPPFTVQHETDGTLWGGDLDAAIDAARAAQKEGEKP